MNDNQNIFTMIAGSMLGLGGDALAFQTIVLTVTSVFTTRLIIRNRIGSLDAIRIVSTMRLVICYILCLGIFLAGYQLLLRTSAPLDTKGLSWWFLKGSLFAFASYLLVLLVGIIVDGGRAIEVITQRYKPDAPREMIELTDLTEYRGRYAQLIPRGCMRAYWFFIIASTISQAIRLK